MRYLGVDFGSKKIGLALSDEAGSMGFPHAVIPNTSHLVEEVAILIAREGVGAVVVGDSRTYDGVENPIMAAARTFASQLGARTHLPVFFEPETLTSAEARRAPGKEARTRTPRCRAPVDASAAALILTSYLSRTDHA